MRDSSRRCKNNRWQERQLSRLNLLLSNINIQCSIEQIRVIIKSFLYECLQMWVSEDTTPWQITKVISPFKRCLVINRIANNAVRLNVRTFVIAIETLTVSDRAARAMMIIFIFFIIIPLLVSTLLSYNPLLAPLRTAQVP